MPSTENTFAIVDINGPFREPREQAFSYDYSIQRATWATPHGVHVKVSIPDEVDVLRERLMGPASGSSGQQMAIGTTQPQMIRAFGAALDRIWRSERVQRMIPTRTWLDTGVPLCLSSDGPRCHGGILRPPFSPASFGPCLPRSW